MKNTRTNLTRKAARILAGSIAAACVIVFLGDHSARAATVTWAVPGGGTWDTATGNWTGGSPTANLFVNGDDALFNNAAGGTITLSGTIAPTTTTVAGVGNYTFAGASLTSGSLTKNGNGTLTLNVGNGYAGVAGKPCNEIKDRKSVV